MSSNQTHLLMTGVSLRALRAQPAHSGLLIQNNGANNVYFRFNRQAENNVSCFQLEPLQIWSLASFCPDGELHCTGTAKSYFGGPIYYGSKYLSSESGLTVYSAGAQHNYLIGTAGASLAITLPSASSGIDGCKVTVMSTVDRVGVTWVSDGGSFFGAPATLTAGLPVTMHYYHGAGAWFRSN